MSRNVALPRGRWVNYQCRPVVLSYVWTCVGGHHGPWLQLANTAGQRAVRTSFWMGLLTGKANKQILKTVSRSECPPLQRHVFLPWWWIPRYVHILYTLTPWSRVLLEKVTIPQLVKKFSAFYGTWRFIPHSQVPATCPYTEPDQTSPYPLPHPTSWRSMLILSSHLRLDLPSGLFPSGFPTKTLYTPLLFTHTCYISRPSYLGEFTNRENVYKL